MPSFQRRKESVMNKKRKKGSIVLLLGCLVLSLFTGLSAVTGRTEASGTLEDGIYSVPVSLWNASKDQASMGNNALYQTGKLVVTEGKATLSMKFTNMEFSGMSGYLMQLDLIKDIRFNEFEYPEEYTNVPAEVISTYAVVDEYNGEDSTDINCAGKRYPKVVAVPVEIGAEYTWAHVYVPVMGSLGFGDQVCRIKVYFNEVKEISEAEQEVWKDFETDEPEAGQENETGKEPDTTKEDKEEEEQDTEEEPDTTKDEPDTAENETDTGSQEEKTASTDKSALKTTLKKADALLALEDKYTKASLSKLKTVIDEAKKVYASTSAAQIVADAQVNALNEAIDNLVEKSGEALDKDTLEDGKYSLYVDLWHATADRASMGNPAFNHEAMLTVKNGVYTMEISTRPMTVGNITACLQTLQIKQTDGSYIYAQITARNNTGGQPSIFKFRLPSREEYIETLIDPKVEVMGDDPLPARLKISWDTLKALVGEAEITENTQAVTTGLDTGAADITDEDTKIRIKADANVLVNGVGMTVKRIDSGEGYQEAVELLGDVGTPIAFYDITLVSPQGSKVQPNGMVQVYIPLPDNMNGDNAAVYRIENGAKTLMSGKTESVFYVFSTNHFSQFALLEKKDNSNTEESGGTIGGNLNNISKSIGEGSSEDYYSEGIKEAAEPEVWDENNQDSMTGRMIAMLLLGLSVICSFAVTTIIIFVLLKAAGRKRNYHEEAGI